MIDEPAAAGFNLHRLSARSLLYHEVTVFYATMLKPKTLELCETIKGHSSQTIRMTKRSLNHESDNLYASWTAGVELLAHVWGSEEAMEGMNAFREKRRPDFNQFRLRNKAVVDEYLDGLDASPEAAKQH